MTALGYRPAAFVPVPAWRRWWPLAREEASSLFRARWGVAMFCVCLVPTLIRLAMLLMVFGVIQFGPLSLRNRLQTRAAGEVANLDPRRAEFYIESVLQVMPGMVCLLLLTSLTVARSIARDRTTNALELYWTRGISPLGYLLAKWVGSVWLVAKVTVVAPLLLWVVAVFLADDWSLFLDSWLTVGAGLVGVAVATAVWTALGTLLSACAGRPNTAMVAWSLLLVGSSAVGVVLAQALREPHLRSTLSVWHAGGVVARAIAGIPQAKVSVAGAATTLGVLLLLLAWRARRRLRLLEAVA
ncbi:MAG: ABC transporter permease [Planctomycetota bacterium]